MINKMTMTALLVMTVTVPAASLSGRAAWAADPAAQQPITPAPQIIPPEAASAVPVPPGSESPKPDSQQAPDAGSTAAKQPSAADAPPAYSPEYKVPIARVGKETIIVSEFMKYVTQDTRLVMKAKTVEGRVQVLREMLIDRLLEEGMYQESLLTRNQAVDNKAYMEAYQKLASRYFPIPEAPAEETLYKYYEEHPEFYGIPAMVRIGQIQFQVPENADDQTKAAAKAKAEEAVKRLRAGESFSVLAELLTDNPQGKVAKGDLGFFQPDKDEWLRKAVTGLTVGQFSEALESPVGYEIILLQDKRDAMIAPYRNVRDNVIARIRQQAQAKAREEYAWKIAKKVGVSVEKPELKSAIPASVAAEIKAPAVVENKIPEAKAPAETKP